MISKRSDKTRGIMGFKVGKQSVDLEEAALMAFV